MSQEHKNKLQQNRGELVENMTPEEIFNVLIASQVITTAEVRRIKVGQRSGKKVGQRSRAVRPKNSLVYLTKYFKIISYDTADWYFDYIL